MKKYEYKIFYLKFKIGSSKEEQILCQLNEFGKEGWRLIRMYGEISIRNFSSWKGGINFLLEREI